MYGCFHERLNLDSDVKGMTIAKDLLQANTERLLREYEANIKNVEELQATLIEEILPSLEDELELTPEAVAWAREWLEDTSKQLAR